ncbi:MAG: hypothetical protein FJ220_02885 [Kiritimatiellaceae bacterium]|nr:hypothetical protein [Kiritimatiellaceae bacterium]
MKEEILYSTLLGAVLLASGLAAQQYSIQWETVDGGGSTATGGVFKVTGTIGQPDAGTMAGGPFTLAGGFWNVQLIQTEGAPWLSLAPAGSGQISISWSPDSPGWILQQTSSLTNTWNNCTSGSTNPVILPMSDTVRFYRLHRMSQ